MALPAAVRPVEQELASDLQIQELASDLQMAVPAELLHLPVPVHMMVTVFVQMSESAG